MPLKRHSALVPISRAHQKGLFLANLIRTGAPVYRGMPTDLSGKLDFTQDFFSGNWPAYRSLEEQVLFPQLVDWTQTYASAVEQLIAEHQAIEDLAHNLPEADAPNLQEAFDELSQALVKHIRFEERIFFEEVQAKATPEEMAVLEKRIATFLSE